MIFLLEYFVNGQKLEQTFERSQITIGRDRSVDFVLESNTVSRQHAVITVDAQGARLTVLSRGGMTALNGRQVTGEVALSDGCQLHFGQMAFTFRLPHANPAQQWNTAPSQGGFGQAPAQGGFGQAPVQGGFGQAPVQGGFGQAPTQGGFGQAPAQGGFGQAPAQGGFGQAPAQGGFGQAPPAEVVPQSPSPKGGINAPKTEDGIRSWDDIAAGAEEDEEEYEGPDDIASNFQRLQNASAKAEEGSKGTSPVVVVGGALLAIGMLIFTFYEPSETAPAPVSSSEERAIIEWKDGDITCTVPADCQAKAIKLYKFSVQTFEKREADIVNLYESYRNMDKAEKLLERGEITDPIPEMKGLKELKAKAEKLMERRFTRARQKFNLLEQRNMHREMGALLSEVHLYFPDKRCKYYRWATAQERIMRDKGIYLQQPK